MSDEKDRVAQFADFRKRMNERILAEPNQVVRRFFALDTQTYQAGALDVKTKELLGLVASMVLRCDDCISYHVAQCKEAGVTREEFFETFSVGLVVGGSIVIPHLRRAVEVRDRSCVFAGCDAPTHWCDVHHVQEWLRDDGETSLDNSALLCERHHTKVHHGFRVERQPDGRWRTWRPDGTEILVPEPLATVS